ncbi:delta(24(24))-sterol reductase protein [Rutstroemia sp. NJR-2017a WRK4]|nr:delta(24(24))-sterol reductase protein [Rutstroemia sp. NJR-2017a WRK4]
MYTPTILKTLILLAITSIATADLHHNGICVNTGSGQNVYNSDATIAACTNYRYRNTGGKWWDTCPDCHMVNTGSPYCRTDAGHMGGDEITYYCKLHGADNALTS